MSCLYNVSVYTGEESVDAESVVKDNKIITFNLFKEKRNWLENNKTSVSKFPSAVQWPSQHGRSQKGTVGAWSPSQKSSPPAPHEMTLCTGVYRHDREQPFWVLASPPPCPHRNLNWNPFKKERNGVPVILSKLSRSIVHRIIGGRNCGLFSTLSSSFSFFWCACSCNMDSF